MRPHRLALGEPKDVVAPEDLALLQLLERLALTGYRFVTPTPATHRRVLDNMDQTRAACLRDLFGWSLPFEPAGFDAEIVTLLERSGLVDTTQDGGLWRSRVRVSSLGDQLYLHSAFPTLEGDAVFFGPDSYRFARFLESELDITEAAGPVVDIGTGSGVGGLCAGRFRPRAPVILSDINPFALRLARVNALAAGRSVEVRCGSGLGTVAEAPGLVVANPPFIACGSGRSYRDGGGDLGSALSLSWASEAMTRLSNGGLMLLYTGAAIVDGRDQLHEQLLEAASARGCELRYRELDPDIFGEELERPNYRGVERIAAVGAVIRKP